MKKLIVDISENNGGINWKDLIDANVYGVIIRLGYGLKHFDEKSYENYLKAKNYGFKVGFYFYDYALNEEEAREEGEFVVDLFKYYKIAPDDIDLGVWYDIEDADYYKEDNNFSFDADEITAMCSAFIVELNKEGYSCGVYACYDWLMNNIKTDLLADYVPYWVAQYNNRCDFDRATLWQFSDSVMIGDCIFNGSYYL